MSGTILFTCSKTRRIGASFFSRCIFTARYESINLLITELCSTRGDREEISICAKHRYLVRVRLRTNTKRDTAQSTRDRYEDPEDNSITCHVEIWGAIRRAPLLSINTYCRETDRLTSNRIKHTHSAFRVPPISWNHCCDRLSETHNLKGKGSTRVSFLIERRKNL